MSAINFKRESIYSTMSSTIKGLVSKKRRRYKQDGFDLDLTYICDNVIAMGFPGEKIEGFYRNNIDDVNKFLETKHKDRYKIYNLCSERSYDSSKFRSGSVAHYPFEDHNPPSLNVIPTFCTDVYNWLSSHPENVAAVHCKAGKGRTGVMVCCYLLHSGKVKTAIDALSYYANMRTHDRKGVTIPSQQRYVMYYEHLLKHPGIEYSQRPVVLTAIKITGSLHIAAAYILSFSLYNSDGAYYESGSVDWRRAAQGAGTLYLLLDSAVHLNGDVKVDVFAKYMMRKEKVCQFWFNTFFLEKNTDEDYEVPKGSIRFTPQESSKSRRDPDLDRTMSCPPPADTQRPALPQMWTRWDSARRLTSQAATASEFSLQTTSKPTLSLKLNKTQLDKAVKDKQDKFYPSNFSIQLEFYENFAENNKSGSWTRSNSENNSHIRGSISSSDSESDESSASSLDKNCFKEPPD